MWTGDQSVDAGAGSPDPGSLISTFLARRSGTG